MLDADKKTSRCENHLERRDSAYELISSELILSAAPACFAFCSLKEELLASWDVAATIHFVQKYIEPLHKFFKATKKQKQGNIKM